MLELGIPNRGGCKEHGKASPVHRYEIVKIVIVESLRIARFRNDGGELHSGDQKLHSNRIQIGAAGAARQDDTNRSGNCKSRARGLSVSERKTFVNFR